MNLFGLTLLAALLLPSGCTSVTRAPSNAPDFDPLPYQESLAVFVRAEMQVRARLREVGEYLGERFEDADGIVEYFSNGRGRTQSAGVVRQAQLHLERLETAQIERENVRIKVERMIREEPRLLQSLLNVPFFRTTLETLNFDEASTYPVKVKRVLRIERASDFLPGAQLGQDRLIEVENLHYTYALEISNDTALPGRPADRSARTGALYAQLTCDKPVKVRRGGERDLADRTEATFTLWNRNANLARTELEFPKEAVRCRLQMTHDRERRSYPLVVKIESNLALEREALVGRVREVCPYLATPPTDGLTAFLSAHYLNMTCISNPPRTELLPDAIEALQLKMVALTGARIPQEVIDRRDARAALDFSRLPKLDAVILTTLEFKNDFYGNMMARALLAQASNGAKVRVMVPQVTAIMKPRDRKLLTDLEMSHPNVAVHYFAFDRFGVNQLHRVIHSKLLITLSRDEPANNLVIAGGRNVKDTFLFRTAPDYSHEPAMTQYGTEEPFFHFQDIEIAAWDRALALQITSQVLSLWHRDRRTLDYRPTTVHLPLSELPEAARAEILTKLQTQTSVRHLISLPYVDDRQMEQLFVDLIDSAHTNLKLMSQYFRPTRELAQALDRAIKRGVEIQLITRLTLAGDNVPGITEQINRASINRYIDKLKIYNWRDGNSFMHAKTVLVDGKVLYIGGTNFNRRSFVHDVENGFIITGADVPQAFEKLFDTVYLPGTDPVTERQRVKLVVRLLIPLLGSLF